MRPRVILHNAISLDGRLDGFPVDLQQYYELAGIWKEDATLAGSDTMLKAAEEVSPEDEDNLIPVEPDPDDRRPLLVIPDSLGRIRTWNYLRTLPYWSRFVALCSRSTPEEYLQYLEKRHIDCIVAGEDHVDLAAALLELNRRYGVKVVRVDAGGTLNRELLIRGLIDEISILVCPYLVGGQRHSCLFFPARTADKAVNSGKKDIPDGPDDPDIPKDPDGATRLELMQMERLKGDVVWLRYKVKWALR